MGILGNRSITALTVGFICSSLPVPSAVFAQDEVPRFELTPFAGYAFGGRFEDIAGGEKRELRDDANFGLILDIREAANTQWEILYSRQATEAETAGAPLDLDVHYIQAGGTYLGHGDRARPFLSATIGATHFEPSLSGLDSETFFSFSVGAGFKLRPNDTIGIRLEARAFGTALESDTDLFCQTGPDENICVVRSDGTILWQFETLAGIVIRF